MDLEAIKAKAKAAARKSSSPSPPRRTPPELLVVSDPEAKQELKNLDPPEITDQEFFSVDFVPAKLTVESLNLFLKMFAKTGNMSRAARAINVAPSTIKNAMKKNPLLKQLVDDTREMLKDAAEEELYRRAVHGTEKAIVYQGEIVDYVREYDSKYLIKLVEALDPDKWTPARKIIGQGDGGISINIVKISTGEVEKAFEIKDGQQKEVIDVKPTEYKDDSDNSTISVATPRISEGRVAVHGEHADGSEGGDGVAPQSGEGPGSG